MTVLNPASTSGAALSPNVMAQGTAAALPGTPATPFYFATDTGELYMANAGMTAWQNISKTSAATFTTASHNMSSNLDITTAGAGIRVKEGTNAKQGLTAAMVSGVVTTADTAVTANSRILYSQQSGTLTGVVTCTRTAGTSFTLTSSVATDTAAFAYQIFEPG